MKSSLESISSLWSWSRNAEYDYLIDINRSSFFKTEDGERIPSDSYSEKASEYGYVWGNIDLPQRFGDSAFWTFDWGDTEIRWSWHTFTVGFGTQNPWLGPAWLNPMLGSNNAATYPKFDIGLRRTKVYLPFCNWYIGDIEGRIWTGLLTESEYYDNDSSNDKRMLNAISAAFSPALIPGFTFGVNRVFVTNWATHNLKYIGRLFTLSHSNGSQVGDHEDEDQKVSLFIDWQFSKIGFEVYGELGLDDFTSHELSNPFHTAIYTVGAKQYIPLPFSKISEKFSDLKSELIFEWNNFEMSQDFQMQWTYSGYYGHGRISQGYTQKGQILGAGTGYAGNSQFLGYKIFFPKGYVMPYFHRHCPDNNYIYSMTVGSADKYGSELCSTHYGCFKTYKTVGAACSYCVMQNLKLDFSFSVIYINYPSYNRNETGEMSYRSTLSLKCIF